MMHQTIIPNELIFDKNHSYHYEEININNLKLIIEPLSFNKYKIIRVISTNPYDYLDPSLKPGNIINY